MSNYINFYSWANFWLSLLKRLNQLLTLEHCSRVKYKHTFLTCINYVSFANYNSYLYRLVRLVVTGILLKKYCRRLYTSVSDLFSLTTVCGIITICFQNSGSLNFSLNENVNPLNNENKMAADKVWPVVLSWQQAIFLTRFAYTPVKWTILFLLAFHLVKNCPLKSYTLSMCPQNGI